jgi:hypothetical protein
MTCELHGENTVLCVYSLYLTQFNKKDNRILSISIDTLKDKIKCEFSLMKILLIRLRRNKNLNDWNLFRELLEKNLDFMLNTDDDEFSFSNIDQFDKIIPGIRTRWFTAFLDTYVDHGTPIESKNALIAMLFLKNEGIFSTLMDFYTLEKKTYKYNYKKDLCGFHIQKETDVITNYINRIDMVLSDTPLILKIFKHMLKRLLQNKQSLYYKVSEICSAKIFKDPLLNFIEKD